MSLISTLENIDQQIVLSINGAHTPLLDQLMYYASAKWTMIPVYLLVLYFMQKNYGWKNTGIILLFTASLIAITDLTCTYLFKETFMRYRPSHHLILKEKLHFFNGYKGGEYGFVSSHAANMTALAVFTSGLLKKHLRFYSITALFLVLIICYSRIYLGVHYLSDILIGALIGFIFANRFLAFLNKSELISNSKTN